MAEKNLSSRIINKHDIEANWVKATNFIPKQGEIIVYDIDENYTYERFKIGDGITLVSNLPFIKTGLEVSDTEEELEEGVYLTNADLLGGIAADNYALKTNVVTSVNGQTGDVVVTEGGGSIDTSNFYSTSNPPPYPVTSVNGSTGAVQITAASLGALTSAPVSSVNGKTGAVTLNASDISGVAPAAHSSSGTTYGIGTSSNYGHVKLSDSTSSTSGSSSGIAATPSAVKSAYDLANNALKFGYTRITLAEVDEHYDINVPAKTAYMVANVLDPLVTSSTTMPSGNYDGFQIEEISQRISYPCSYIVPIQCKQGLVPAITNNESSGALILYNHGSSNVSMKNSVNLLFFNPTSSVLTYRLYNWY